MLPRVSFVLLRVIYIRGCSFLCIGTTQFMRRPLLWLISEEDFNRSLKTSYTEILLWVFEGSPLNYTKKIPQILSSFPLFIDSYYCFLFFIANYNIYLSHLVLFDLVRIKLRNMWPTFITSIYVITLYLFFPHTFFIDMSHVLFFNFFIINVHSKQQKCISSYSYSHKVLKNQLMTSWICSDEHNY